MRGEGVERPLAGQRAPVRRRLRVLRLGLVGDVLAEALSPPPCSVNTVVTRSKPEETVRASRSSS